jgi:hypothetical protein
MRAGRDGGTDGQMRKGGHRGKKVEGGFKRKEATRAGKQVAVRHQPTQVFAPLKISHNNRGKNEANQVSPFDQNLLISLHRRT